MDDQLFSFIGQVCLARATGGIYIGTLKSINLTMSSAIFADAQIIIVSDEQDEQSNTFCVSQRGFMPDLKDIVIFSTKVPIVYLSEVRELLICTQQAIESFEKIPVRNFLKI